MDARTLRQGTLVLLVSMIASVGCVGEDNPRATYSSGLDSIRAIAQADSALNFQAVPRRGSGVVPHRVVQLQTFECGFLIDMVADPPRGVAVTGGGGTVFVANRAGPCVLSRGM